MNRHKHLKRLERLRDAVLDYYHDKNLLSEDEGLWTIWCALKKDIEKCGSSAVFKIDGLRLYYYNELWKKVNNKDHALENMKIQLPPVVTYKDMKFTDTMDRAERLAKQPLPGYMWTEAK